MSSSPSDDLWIRRFRPAPEASERLVCFPHAGGSASFYVPVAAALAPGVDVVAVQYPGRQDRRLEPGLTSVAELADRVAEALGSWDDRPLTFFGHSMGAVVAFEVARRMERAGSGPVRLFASGRRAPSRTRDETVHTLGDDGLVAELRALSGTDARFLEDEELLRMVLPAIRSDYTAVETYLAAPGDTVRCPVTVLVGDSDPKTSLEEARAWGGHTLGGSELRIFPGGHFYLSDRSADVLAVLTEHFAAAPSRRA
ncbi:alpha/beta fold hydrolase [Streptomyces sp. NBC_01136]|uniref:thioesterase II family protein n=1 Tax=unclassified Streptomyces TaxID=2593676 RepID=UPI003245DD17|nr:alpha/beta fold hydrolase [Streptomyces sp. NBC_01136]WST81137.1 alpha/beta fold hydrolase [Streptomyces sp. NBC_01136]